MRRCKKILLILLTILSAFIFSSCESLSESGAYFDYSKLGNAVLNYSEAENRTQVIYSATVKNDTIYDIKNISVQLKLNGETIRTERFDYEIDVRHGKEFSGNFSFYSDGKIDSVSFISWSATMTSFFETYSVWLIAVPIVVGIALIIYVIVMIIEDLEFDDLFEFIVEAFGIIFMLLIASGGIGGFVGLAEGMIVLCGIVLLVLLIFFAQFIKYIIVSIAEISFDCDLDDCLFCGNSSYEYADRKISGFKDMPTFSDFSESISECASDKDKLMQFSVEELKAYCREKGIRGYSSAKKSEIIDMIVNNHDDNTEKSTDSTSRNTAKPISGITFNDISGLEDVKKAFKEKTVYAFQHKELYEKYGKKVGGGLLLYGLPGTGKTMFAEAASNETDSLFIPIKCSDIKSKWYGESEANVKSIFDKARKAKKAIIFFDEFEAIGAKRTDGGENGNNDLVPQILAEMQGINQSSSNSMILVIAATNKPWAIDSAFLRPGRFDEKIYVPLPDEEARKKLFELKLKNIPQENLDFDNLSKITEGFNGADIVAFCDKLKMLAINKSIESGHERPITEEDVSKVEKIIRSSVSSEDIERLLEFKRQYG